MTRRRSCSPNAEWTYDPHTLSLTLTAVRHINPREEVTIAYLPPYAPFAERRMALKNLFGFDCACASCARVVVDEDGAGITASDEARAGLLSFWDTHPSFSAWASRKGDNSDFLLIEAHVDALRAIEREGLEVLSTFPRGASQWDLPYDDRAVGPVPDVVRHTDGVAMCFGALADMAGFRTWLRRAVGVRGGGFEGRQDSRLLEAWIKHPEAYPAWGLRRK